MRDYIIVSNLPGVFGLLFPSEMANSPGLAWMNSMSESDAPSPIGYFWYRGTLMGGTFANLGRDSPIFLQFFYLFSIFFLNSF
jgi:hypothetical protein